MEHYTPKYRRDPNAKVDTLYYGVASGGALMTSLTMRHPVEDRMATTRSYEPGLARGQGGQIARFILGGMETTLDEMEYILEARKQKPFVPRRTNREIADMCHLLTERRNDQVRYFQANPSEKPKKKPVRLHLPVGCRWMSTPEPGFKVVARI